MSSWYCLAGGAPSSLLLGAPRVTRNAPADMSCNNSVVHRLTHTHTFDSQFFHYTKPPLFTRRAENAWSTCMCKCLSKEASMTMSRLHLAFVFQACSYKRPENVFALFGVLSVRRREPAQLWDWGTFCHKEQPAAFCSLLCARLCVLDGS